jgi:squalene-hopene/tetraprenyl-beta-curcumene cyclase
LNFLREVARFEGPQGGFEESPLMVALVCIGLSRAGTGRDIVDHCVSYLRRTARADGSWAVTRDLEFTVTALLTVGLREAGQIDATRLERTVAWMRGCQMTEPFAPTGAPAGGWQWSQPSGWPGTLDTADGVDALCVFGQSDGSVRRGVQWLLDMQNADGSWSYFCRNSRLPVDSPCSLMTAHAMIALRNAAGMTAADIPIARAARWIARTTDQDGALSTAWYTGLTAGTGSALAALGRVGLADSPAARKLTGWITTHQNPDGGWGDGAGGASTVEETCWALLGLADSAGPGARQAAAEESLVRGAAWLLDRQGSGGAGLWAPAYVGVYIDDLLFASDHFANGYALQALGRVRQRLYGPAPEPARFAAGADGANYAALLERGPAT